MTETIFAISLGYNKAEITSHCWGDGCGKGCAGGMDICGAAFIPCYQPAENCPLFDDEIDMEGETDRGEKIVVRKLKREADR